jgi:hypothetical protein
MMTKMSSRTAIWLAWTLCALTLVLLLCAVVLFAFNRHVVPQHAPYLLLPEVFAALVGSLVVSHKPRNPIGWFIVGHALCFSLGEFTRQYATYGVVTQPDSLPLAQAMASPAYWIWYPGVVLMFCFMPLYFPNGRLLSPRWRPVVWLAASAAVIMPGIAAVQPSDLETPGIPNPLGVEALRPFTDTLESILLFWVGVVIASAASLVMRFRRSRGEERQQIKWVVYAVVFVVFYLVTAEFLWGFLPDFVNEILSVVALSGLWAAILVAILKYRLYDIDLLINRTLVYGSLTALLALVYFGGVTATQAIVQAFTGQEEHPQLAIVASTLVIAALFNPLRKRIQAFIDRRFYRRKYDAARTMAAFNARLRDETELETLSGDVARVVAETMQPAHVSMWLRPDTFRKRTEIEGSRR